MLIYWNIYCSTWYWYCVIVKRLAGLLLSINIALLLTKRREIRSPVERALPWHFLLLGNRTLMPWAKLVITLVSQNHTLSIVTCSHVWQWVWIAIMSWIVVFIPSLSQIYPKCMSGCFSFLLLRRDRMHHVGADIHSQAKPQDKPSHGDCRNIWWRPPLPHCSHTSWKGANDTFKFPYVGSG